MEVRRATPIDAFAIAELHVASWRAAYAEIMPQSVLEALSQDTRAARWLSSLGSPGDTRTWVAEEADTVIGFVSAGPCRDADAGPRLGMGEVYALYVHPARWRRGAGAALLGRAAQDLRYRGYSWLTLWVLEANQSARRFYEAEGLGLDGATQVEHRGNVALPQLRYRRPL
jgi:GNAT superfamily N-acetyltransferase